MNLSQNKVSLDEIFSQMSQRTKTAEDNLDKATDLLNTGSSADIAAYQRYLLQYTVATECQVAITKALGDAIKGAINKL